LQHTVSAQQIASPHPYKKDYKEQMVGKGPHDPTIKGPHDPTIGYPEHDHHKKVGDLTSSVSFYLFFRNYLYFSIILSCVLHMDQIFFPTI